jgi:hypothetical protein
MKNFDFSRAFFSESMVELPCEAGRIGDGASRNYKSPAMT